MRVPISFQSYLHRYGAVSAERLINWMPQRQPREAKAPVVLMPTPGLLALCTTNHAGCRGQHVMGSYLYSVVGTAVYRVAVDGSFLKLGNVDPGGPVRMDSNNGGQLAVVVPDTGRAWIATSSTLALVSDADLPSVADVAFLDGYFAFVRKDTQRFHISALNDGTSFDALDFASAESSPDNLLAVRRVGQSLWLVGERSTEVWENSNNADFPFARKYGGVIPAGTAAAASVAVREQDVFWLGQNRVVYQAGAGQPQPISTPALDQAIAGYTTVSDAEGWCHDTEGHQLYVLTFPSAGATWVYDLTSQAWHERESNGYGGRWRATAGVSFAGAVVVGDATGRSLYLLRADAFDEDGTAITRVATTPPQHADGRRMFFSRMHLDCATGVGLQSGQGSDPQIWLQWSDDDGRTWSSERWESLGAAGAPRRVVWDRLGASRGRSWRFGMSDPVGTALIACNVEMTVGAN
jgi:hypothetical protein